MRDLFVGPPGERALTMAELLDFVMKLPPDSATAREMLGPAAAWSPEVHKLTDLADLLAQNNYITARAAGGKAKTPKPIKRPAPPDQPGG